MRKLSKFVIFCSLLGLVLVALFVPSAMAGPDDGGVGGPEDTLPPSLSLELTCEESDLVVGADDITFSAKISNADGDEFGDATNIKFEATLDSKITPKEDSITARSDDDPALAEAVTDKKFEAQKVTATVPSLPKGKSVIISFKGHLTEEATGQITQSAQVRADLVEEPVQNSLKAPVTVKERPKATLSIDKTADKEASGVEGNGAKEENNKITYTITVSNTEAKSIAHNVVITDDLNTALTIEGTPKFVQGTGDVQVQGQKVTGTIGNLEYGTDAKLEIVCWVQETALATIVNSATLSADEIEHPGTDPNSIDSSSVSVNGNTGVDPAVNVSALSELIRQSTILLNYTEQSSDGNDIGDWAYWVTPAQFSEFSQAVEEARNLLTREGISADDVSQGVDTLTAAKTKFESARKTGTKAASGTTPTPANKCEYGKQLEVLQRANGKETRDLMGSEDLKTSYSLDESQLNYTREATGVSSGDAFATSFAIASAKWTNKSAGELELTYSGAYYEQDEALAAPVYCFTVCTAHNLAKGTVDSNIETLLKYYDSLVCLGIDSGGSVHQTTFSQKTATSSSISSWTHKLDFSSGVHYSERIPGALREYITGSSTGSMSSIKHRPAAIYVSCDACQMNTGGTGSDANFWNWIVDNYINTKDGLKKYQSMSASGATTIDPVIGKIYDPTWSAGSSHADLDYSHPFSADKVVKVPKISFRGTIAPFIVIDSEKAYLAGKELKDGENNAFFKVNGKDWEIGSLAYEYRQILEVKITGHIAVNDSAAGLDWFDTLASNSSVELLSYGDKKNGVSAPKLRQTPNLTIAKDVSVPVEHGNLSPAAQKGDIVTWTIDVSNNGNGAAQQVVVSDTFPAGLTLLNDEHNQITSTIDGQPAGEVSTEGNRLTVNLGATTLAPNKHLQIVAKTQFGVGNEPNVPVSNTASVTELLKSMVQDSAEFKEVAPKLKTTKLVNVENAVLNDEVTYTITVHNDGDAEARNVVVTDEVPSWLTPFGDVVCDDEASGSFTDNNLRVTDKALPAGGTLTITFTARVNETSEYGKVENSEITNADYVDPISASDDFDIIVPKLGIEKSIIHKASESGETDNADDLVYAQTDDVVTYQVVVSNETEYSLARDVELTDILPNGLDLVGEVTVNGQPTSSKLDEALALGNIAYGTPVTITYPVVVSMGDDNHPDNLANITNSVSASGKSPIETVSTSKDLQILYPRLEIVKTVDDDVAQADDILNYTVTITNPVEHTIAHGTDLIDTFPADFEATGQMYLDGEPIEPDLPSPANVVYQFEGENTVYAPSDMIDVYIESDPVTSLHMHKQCPYVGEETEPQSVSVESAYNIVKTSTLEDGSKVVPCPVCTNLLEHDADIESVYSYTHNGADVDVSSNMDLIIATKDDGSVVKHLDSQCENLIDDVTTTPYSVIPAIAYRYPCTNADSPFYMDKVSACPVCADLVEQNVQGDAVEADSEPSIASFLGELFGIAPAAETSDFSAVPDRDVFNKYEIGDTVFGEPHTITFSGTVNNNPECETIAPTATTSANHIEPVSSGTSTKIVHPALAIKETVDTQVAQADDILTYKINVTNTDTEAESRETVLHHVVDENLELLDFVLESDSPAEQQPDEQKPDEQSPDDQGSVEDVGGEVAPADEAPEVYYYNEILGKLYSPEDTLSLVVETADDGSSIAHIGKDCSTIVGNLSEDELQTTLAELMAGQDAEGAPLPKPCESCLSLAQVTAQDTVAQHTYKLGELTLSPDTPVSVFSEAGAENTVIHGNDACEKIAGEVTTEAMYPAFLSDFLAKLPEGTVACPDCMQLAVDTKEVSVSELLGTPAVPDDGTPRGQILTALYGVLSGNEYVSADQDARLSQVDALMSSLQDQGAISGYAFDEPKECVSWNLVNGGSFTCPIDAKPAASVESLASFDLGTIAPQATKTVVVRAKVKNVDELQKIPSSVSTDARYVIHVDTGVDVDIVHPTLEIQKFVDKSLVQTDDMLNYEIVVKNPVQYSEARNTKFSDVLSGPLGRVSELVVERDTSAVTPKPEWPDEPSEPDTPENPDSPETPSDETYYMVKGYNKVYKLSDTVPYSLEIPAGGSNTWHLDKYCPWGGRADYQDSITIEEYLERSSYNPNTDSERPPMNGNSPCDLCGKLVEVKASDFVNKVSYKVVATDETHSPEETVTVYRDDALDKDTTQRIHLNPECSKLISVDSPQEYVWTYGAMNNRIESIYADDPDADYVCPDCAQIEKIEEPITVAKLLESQSASVPAMAAEESTDNSVQETPESTPNQGTMSDESKFPEATLDTPSTDPANIDLGTIAGGEVVYIRYKAQILDSDETEVGNTASVSADYVAETSANTKTEVIYPSLLIEQTVDKDLCQTDDVLNYTVVVSNPVERSVARNVVLTETFPSGLQYMEDAVVDGNPVSSAPVMAEETTPAPEVSDENTETPLAGIPLGDIAPDKPVTINFSATVTELEKDSVTPIAYAEGFHLEQINAPVTTEIVYPELAITKDVDKKDTHLGDELNYTVVIRNDVDRSVARGSMFKDVFPAGLEPISDAKVEGLEGIATIKSTDTGYEAELGDIPAGSPVTITYLAKVTSKGNESLQNVASVYGKYIATAEAPIVADAEVAVAPPKVSIEKSAAPESVEVGESIAYKLVVTNESDGPAQSVVVTDTLKNGGSYSGEPTVEGANVASSDWGKDTSSELTLDEIPAKGSVTITYNVSTEGCKSGEFVNEATADTEFQDPATASATVNLFTISQTSGTQTGDSVTYLMDTGVFAIGLSLVAAGVVVTGILVVKNRRH